MTKTTKHVLIALFIGAGIFVVYSIYKTISAGLSDIGSIIDAPFSFAKSAYGAVAHWFSTLTSGSSTAPGPAAQAQAASTLTSMGIDPNSPASQIVLSAYNPPSSSAQQPGTLNFAVLNDGSTAVLNPSALAGTSIYPGP